MPLTKTCRKCGKEHPASVDFFYRHPSGKYGLTPRCKPCVDEDNKATYAKRLARDPETVRAQASERTKRHYQRNLEGQREKNRILAAKRLSDPEQRAKINMAKRGGGARMTQEQFETLFVSQGYACAICKSTDPRHKNGWNIDHCHKTNQVRFILCPHCNRGLGAFRDNPQWLRKAADMLEEIQNQPDRPVEAIHEKS